MPQGRNIESTTLEELFSSSTAGSLPILIDIRHDALKWKDSSLEQEDRHMRLINAPTAVRYNGHKYLPAVFGYTMPTEDGTKVGNSTITISAIDQRVVELIRSIRTPPVAVIEAFFTKPTEDSFAFSRLYHYEFEMRDVTWDATTAKWILVFDPVMQINVPKDLATRSRVPAVLVK